MRILDLYCGAGGEAYGFKLHSKDHYVVGVDNNPKPRKRFLKHCGDEFITRNVLSLPKSYLQEFDFIWASPPCQSFVSSAWRDETPNLIPPTRYMLEKADVPYVIENVPAAPLFKFITLCGTMFPPLRVVRHRRFEFHPDLKINQPEHIRTSEHPPVFNNFKRTEAKARGLNEWDNFITVAGNNACLGAMSEAMGIYWMTRPEIAEAVPPRYSKYICNQIQNNLNRINGTRPAVSL
jgi:DNA (cytosine-5)-methyltransferase 1